MPDSVTVIFEDKTNSITFLCFMARTFFASIKTSKTLNNDLLHWRNNWITTDQFLLQSCINFTR